MRQRLYRLLRLQPLWLLLFPLLTIAAVATAAQIAQAVLNAPGASQWLRDNANAVANLAINVESRGETTAYNGSCCYGVLQMNQANIRQYANMTPGQYQQLDLQSQVNAWVSLTNAALQASAPQTLAAMVTFGGRQVDANLVLACVQLGIGNCQKMINSGSCSGFADSNGTTICAMADRISGGTSSSGGSSGGGIIPSTGTGGVTPTTSCTRDANGICLSVTEAIRQGFEQGSGVPMASLRFQIQGLIAALTFLIAGGMLLALWRQYAAGAIGKPQLIEYTQKTGLVVMLVLIAMSLA